MSRDEVTTEHLTMGGSVVPIAGSMTGAGWPPRRDHLGEPPTTGVIAPGQNQSDNWITMPAELQVAVAPKARNRRITLVLSEATDVMIRFAGRGR